jgi:hypothetical protein
LAFRPLQDGALLRRYEIDPAAALVDVHAVDLRRPDARVSSGADAVAMVVSQFAGGGRLRRVARVPGVVRMTEIVYRVLTRGRRLGARCC